MRQSEPVKNRYGDEYYWKEISENVFQFYMTGDSMMYCRMGGKEGQSGIDENDLGMFDPSGGPYVELGSKLFGQTVTKIRSVRTGQDTSAFVVEVE